MPAMQSTVLFHAAARGLSRRRIRAFAKRLETEVAGGRTFCCWIADDGELRRLNRKFLRRDYATDVLSFPSEHQGTHSPCGELAISFNAAKRQAAEYGHSIEEEIEILMLHGLLHLAGMDHETDGGRMSRAERKWRVRFGLAPGLIERVGA